MGWDFFSAYKHIRKIDCAFAIGCSTLVLCFEKHLIDLCVSVQWAAPRVGVCIPDWRQVQLQTEVIQSSEKNICAGNENPDSLLDYPILCGTVGDSSYNRMSLISYCISAQECGFSISICLPNSVTIFSVCLKGSLIWLISLHSELNFFHSQKSYFLLDCKCLFCFAVQSCIAVSLKNYFFCVKFQTNSWVISLVLKLETNKIWMYLIFCQALVCFYSNYCIQP